MNIAYKTRPIDRIISTAAKHLVGKTITSIDYMSEKECENNGWNKSGVIIGLDDGTYLYPLSDDEGNEVGAIDTTNEKIGLLGTIRV